MSVDAPVAQVVPAYRRGWVILRVVMAVAWVVWAALAWWSAPRQATSEQLSSDLAAGRVASFSTADVWEWPAAWGAPARPRLGQNGRMLVWTTINGQTFYMTGSGDIQPGSVPYGGDTTVTQIASGLAVLMIVTAIAILLGAHDPVRGTRWFWFWVGQLPLGIGYLSWLAWERPWSSGREGVRRSGWVGLGVLLVGGLLLSGLILLARNLFGPWVIPG